MNKRFLFFFVFSLIFATITPAHAAELLIPNEQVVPHIATYYVKEDRAEIYETYNSNSNIITYANKGTMVHSTNAINSNAYIWYKVNFGGKVGWIRGEDVSKDNLILPHKATFYINIQPTKIYETFKTTSKVILTANKGTKVLSSNITNINGVTWYNVKVGTKTGWVQSATILRDSEIKPFTSSFYANSDIAKMYQSFKTSSQIITTPKKGSIVQATSMTISNGVTWYKVKSGSKVGWLPSSFVSKNKVVVKYPDYLSNLKKIASKNKATVKKQIHKEGIEYTFKKGWEEAWITQHTHTKIEYKNVHYIKGKTVTAPPKLFNLGLDSAITIGFPISKTELTSLARKAQSSPHKTFYSKSKKVRAYADRGKQVYLTFYEDPDADKLLK
ncbi:hypothetical protein [Bacillus suaedaesalsae]|uniref:SH3b domain-containing protein n=1 Tax=Bacillus suaedaesalsae TaxID=2810349 RepID=A0ABS2DKU7_9BACI|nr:hypothetical protein [Bacillus suaedaesalsae]MBM6619117.1 hypothetical protein [Bacillus suaedaesalsae]